MKFLSISLRLLFLLLLAACHQKTQITSPQQNQTQSLTRQLVDEYSLEVARFDPIKATQRGLNDYNGKFLPEINQSNRDKYLAFETLYLNKAQAIDPSTLSGQDLLTYRVFINDRKLVIDAAQYPEHLIPINQMYGVHNLFAQLGSGKSFQPFNSEVDYRNFIQRANGFSRWTDSAIESMREGIKKGIVQPKAIVSKILPQISSHIVDDIKQSVFYAPLNRLPEGISQNLVNDYRQMIKQTIIPTYKRLYLFMKDEYQPQARNSVGLRELPDGKRWYDLKIRTHTTLPLTADEIHQYGKQEVARILAEMKKVKQTVKFEGDLAEFFNFLRNDEQFYFTSKDDLINAYIDVKTKIDATLPKLFDVFPKAGYEVHAVPDFQAASAAGASYEGPAPDGSRPGIFYINTHNLKSQPKFIMETLSIHEAAPGHHFQIAIQQEVKGLPDYRKFGGYTVFSEGWALYAESLGKELGLFTDPYMWYGRLVDEQLRAMRLVVDTGIHSKGWSREKAIDFMLENSSMARSDVEAEVERYIVIPGQALAYKIGQKKIRELREYGEKTLGAKFNIRKFHSQLLIDGSLPMPVLEDKIKLWVNNQK